MRETQNGFGAKGGWKPGGVAKHTNMGGLQPDDEEDSDEEGVDEDEDEDDEDGLEAEEEASDESDHNF